MMYKLAHRSFMADEDIRQLQQDQKVADYCACMAKRECWSIVVDSPDLQWTRWLRKSGDFNENWQVSQVLKFLKT